ncbi:voltage-dependent calcium channel subunit alpha-2/delta-3-like isoform X2 [Asterias amurensis]|uniref:voltage-dependent calcium channel subunit alpha-2/delta-3-like isoform X2 n=1 Tax=Asterias amurensis TaxID=7602 RepID=UPI003AB218F4
MTELTLIYLRLLLITGVLVGATIDVNIDKATVAQWAETFGSKLYEISLKYSGAEFLRREYEKRDDMRVERANGMEIVEEMATNMEKMLEAKVHAVENLRNKVEDAHENHDYNESTEFEYFNSNLINTETTGRDDRDAQLRKPFHLDPNVHFNNISVNINQSTVQVPANVYNFGPDVLNGVEETEFLDDVFQQNYEADPTLTWQYFGHNTGFFRNYPGIQWEKDSQGLDLYDCRKRGWYISSATSPKDIVILVDTSGSMTGVRIEIAKHTVNTIMGTLGDDDFFNVLTFSDDAQFIQPCFNGTLVQANADNKNLIKQGLSRMPDPKNMANLNDALTGAFDLLESFQNRTERFNNTGTGANCNQALMLITDGAHETFEDVFDKYNEDRHVRVFTYLIGGDIKDDPNVQNMSCSNKGYYTRIGAIADVEENASKYIHVLSRPMVIEQHHITVWTNVYMDTLGLHLMTTVSQPVFNKKESNREQGILLGVAGVDVPVKELLKLTPPYKLGVNGYPFAITNNGYILYHPDLRPKDSYGNLKPNYNSVDLAEVELSDVDEQLRTAMVDRKTGYMNMTVRIHSKDMKRLYFRLNHYYYTDLAMTPFSFGIVLSGEAGHNQLIGYETFTDTSGDGSGSFIADLCLLREGIDNLFGYEETDRVVLANWIYCNLNNTEARRMSSPKALETYLHLAMDNGGYLSDKCDAHLMNHVIFDANVTQPLISYWEDIYSAPAQDPVTLSNETLATIARYQALCNNETLETDANMVTDTLINPILQMATDNIPLTTSDTGWSPPFTSISNTIENEETSTDTPSTPSFLESTQDESSEGNVTDMPEFPRPGIILSFVGTKGGLTRVFQNPHSDKQSNFGKEFVNTVEEEYYQRASSSPTDKFIYSVPLQGQQDGFTSDSSEYLVTASTAVLVKRDNKSSLAAAIGHQMLLDDFRDLLMETTLNLMEDCNDVAYHCELTCYNDSVGCYLLDEHGYVVVSKEQAEVGVQFASLTQHAVVFDAMLERNVFTEIKHIDYQAMCTEIIINVNNAASHLLDPLISLGTFVMGFTKQLILVLSHLGLFYSRDDSFVGASTSTSEEVIYEPCDQEMLYFIAQSERLPKDGYVQCQYCRKSYSIHNVPHSNLILLVVDSDCECVVTDPINLQPTKVVYNSVEWCERLRTQTHRRRPESCHSEHDLENSTDCGRGTWLRPSMSWMLLMLLLKAILTQASLRS